MLSLFMIQVMIFIKKTELSCMIAQWVLLLLHRSRVSGLILSSVYCLCRVSVNTLRTWVSSHCPWTCYAKLPLGVNECLKECVHDALQPWDWHPTQGEFSSSVVKCPRYFLISWYVWNCLKFFLKLCGMWVLCYL